MSTTSDPLGMSVLSAKSLEWRKTLNSEGAHFIASRGINDDDPWVLLRIEFESAKEADREFEKRRKKLKCGVLGLVSPDNSIRSIVGHIQ